jgi:hypothetical protein
MKRRNIFKALTGLFAAKSLPAAPVKVSNSIMDMPRDFYTACKQAGLLSTASVKVPASLQVAKAAAATNPLFTGAKPQWHGMGLIEWMVRHQEARAKEVIEALPVAQRADCIVVHDITTGSYKAMTKEDYTAERRQNCLFGPTPGRTCITVA